MGRDKASIRLAGSTLTLAQRAGKLLGAAVSPGPAIEVGPGSSRLGRAADFGVSDPGTGPLTAAVAGCEALERSGFSGPVLVLAADLPWLTPEVLAWLVGFPGSGSVVPVVAGRSQPLCARWSLEDLGRAAALARQGERSVRAVFGPAARFADEACWGAVAEPLAFADADTPEDLWPGPHGSELPRRERRAPARRWGPGSHRP